MAMTQSKQRTHNRHASGLRRFPWVARAEVATLAFFAWLLLRLLKLTVRVRSENAGLLQKCWREGEPVVLAFWHGRAVMLPFFYSGRGVYIMNSTHRDGEIVSRALHRFGIMSTRGSSSRGAVGGLLALARAARRGFDVALIPDGPRGPAGEAKAGAIELARLSGALLFPVSASCKLSFRGTGWDRMMIPLPGAELRVVVGDPIDVSRDRNAGVRGDGNETRRFGRESRERLRAELELALKGCTRRADKLAGRIEEDA